MKFETKAIHVGQEADPTTGATVPPIYMTSTYTQMGIGDHKGYEYTRTGNPTRASLESCLASLEEGSYGLAFASGLAATQAVLSILKPGDHVVAAEDLYGGTYRLFERVFAPMGIEFTYVDGRDLANFQAAFKSNTKLVWAETPTNPLLFLTDLEALAKQTHGRGYVLVVDNTFATPYFQKPLTLGADIVVHSTTKYIGGHSDVVGGAVVTNRQDLYDPIKFYQNAAGGVPSPFDSWLTLRGLKTLAARMRAHQENAFKVADFLLAQKTVEKVHYPGLTTHPQHELAKKQMTGFGGIISFQLRGGLKEADAFFRALKVFSFAESLGGVESLACYPSKMTHGSIPQADRERRGITDGTVRLSVGLEHPDDLVEDLRQAFTRAFS